MAKKINKWVTVITVIALIVAINPIYVFADSEVSQPLVSVYSNHVKKVAAYEIIFNTGDTDSSVLKGNSGDTISVNFPAETVLPSSISNSNIKINGEVINQGSVGINKSGGNNAITIPVPSNLTIAKNSFVQIEISQAVGIINPSVAGSQYYLQVWTSQDTIPVNSAYYSIFDSVITVPEVTASPNIVGEVGAYFVNFRTSTEGNLTVTDRVYFLFPLDTFVPNSINKADILINNIPLKQNPIITSDSEGRFLLEMVVPLNIGGGKNVNIQIKPDAGIVHPTTEDNYTLSAWTSQDLVKNKSVEYLIANAITGVNVWVSPDIGGQIGQYNIAMQNGNQQLESTDSITILFPEGTQFTKTNIADNVYIDGVKLAGSAVVNSSELTITINIAKEVAPNQIVNILFLQNSGITNPLKESDYYTIQTKTTKDIAYRSSNYYSIQGNHIVNLNASVSQNAIGLNGEYLIQFKVSSVGGLLGGLDTVTIIFPEGTVLPNSLNYTLIQVNDKTLDKSVTLVPSIRTLKFTVPTGVNVLQDGDVTINILSSAQIKNPGIVGDYSLLAYTSRDPIAVESSPYKIGKQISTPTVSVSPNTYQSYGQYAIGFYTSNIGALSNNNNDFIEIKFPNGTVVPSSISTNYIEVNGNKPSKVEVSQQAVKVYLPSGMTVNANGYIGLVFLSSAGIKNPSSGTYQLIVNTSQDTSFVASQSYTTTGSATTNPPPDDDDPSDPTDDNDVKVELSTNMSGAVAEYLIKYKTSSSGALSGGIDEFTITFSSRVELPNYIAKETIKVNNVPINSGWVRRSGQSITFHLPSTIYVPNNTWVDIFITEQAEIRNPSRSGRYSLNVETSKDTDSARVYYSIQGGTAGSLSVTPEIDSAGKIDKYYLTYTTSSRGSLNGGYDIINLRLPNTYNYQQILANISIKVNGYPVTTEMIQLSGSSLSFLLPYQVDIGNRGKLYITIEDSNNLLMPRGYEKIVFSISTSKDTSWTSSNEIDLSDIVIPDNGNQDDGGGENDSPSPEPSAPSKTTIKLVINKKEALVNGEIKTLSAAPQIINKVTMVPLRFITEVLGGTADYRKEEKRIIIVYKEDYLVFTLNSTIVYSKDKTFNLEIAPKIVNGSAIVPLRFISEWMNIYTEWNGKEQSILLIK